MPDDLLDLDYPAPPPPADLAARAVVTHRRRRRRAVAGSAAVAALAVGALVVVTVPRPGQQTIVSAPAFTPANPSPGYTLGDGVAPVGGPPAVAVSPSAGRPPGLVLPAAAAAGQLGTPSGALPSDADGISPLPATFIGGTPGGAEKPTVFSAATGGTVKVLGDGSQSNTILSPDGRTLYRPVDSPDPSRCDQQWTGTDVASAQVSPAPAFQGLIAAALSPDQTELVTTLGPGACLHPMQDDFQRVVVRDLTGHELRSAVLPAGNWFAEAWTGGMLLLSNRTGLSDDYVAVDATTLSPVWHLPLLPAGCQAGEAVLRDADDVAVMEACTTGGTAHLDVVDLSTTTSAELRRVTVTTVTVPAGTTTSLMYGGLAVDASGDHLLLTIPDEDPSQDGRVAIVTGSTVTRLPLKGVYGVDW